MKMKILRKGFNEMVSAVILLAIAVTIGVMVWGWASTYFSKSMYQTDMSVVVNRVTLVSSGSAIAELKIKNIGTSTLKITNITVTVEGVTAAITSDTLTGKVIGSGKDVSGIIQFQGINVEPGRKVIFIISAQADDGTTITKIAEAIISS